MTPITALRARYPQHLLEMAIFGRLRYPAVVGDAQDRVVEFEEHLEHQPPCQRCDVHAVEPVDPGRRRSGRLIYKSHANLLRRVTVPTPSSHQLAALLQQVPPPICCFGLVADGVR